MILLTVDSAEYCTGLLLVSKHSSEVRWQLCFVVFFVVIHSFLT